MAVTIRGKTLPLPILQGGMGVGISLDGLAGAVAACGGMGTLSTAVCGFAEPDFAQHPFEANLRALERQVRRAKELAHGAGLIAVNAMVATTQYLLQTPFPFLHIPESSMRSEILRPMLILN